MEDEGIMALPQGMTGLEGMPASEGMASPQAMGEMPVVTSMDSYDAAQTALGMVDPAQLEAMKVELRATIAELDLTPAQVNELIAVLEYMTQNPDQYPALRAQLIQLDYADPEDLPEQYDVEFIGAMLIVLNEVKSTQAQGAQAPMSEGPPIEGMAPMAMAGGGLADVAQYLAAQGRNGDSILAHITPGEARLLQARGGSGTINPATGLPEFFLKKLFKSIGRAVKKVLKSPIGRILGTIALATVLGPAGLGLSMGTASAVAGAGTALAAGGSVKEALVSAAMGYIGGGGTIMGANPVAAVGQYLPGAAGSALNTGLSTAAIGTGVGLVAGMRPSEALKMGAMSGASAAALQGLQGTKAGEVPLGQQGATPAPVQAAAPQGIGEVASGGIGDATSLLSARPAGSEFAPQEFMATPSAAPGQALAPMQAANTPPSTYMDDFYKEIGITPERMVKATGPFESNVGIERGTLGMTSASDTMRQAMRDPIATAKDFYSQNLSPERPGLPKDAGLIRRYAPLAATGLALTGAAGGFKGSPSNPNPLFNRSYGGLDFIRDNPEMFKGGLDFGYVRPDSPPSAIVPPTPSYSTIPVGPPATVMPTGVTMSPAGVSQPYNVAGMYGVPLLYNNQPRRYAEGGQATHFPRKTGPIDGPGTGTSDSIPAMLSDGEFVFTAKAVRNAGGGSRRKGAARMYKMMKMLEGGPVKAK